MAHKDASDVARRCLCLELLLQRLGLEIDDEDPETEREAVRRAWLSRLGQLGLENVLVADERALLERGVGGLSDGECDDIEGRVIGALVLLWALGRIEARPTARSLGDATVLIAEHGILGDGSIPGAKSAIMSVELRDESALREALDAYASTVTVTTASTADTAAEAMVATIAVGSLSWVLDGPVASAPVPS